MDAWNSEENKDTAIVSPIGMKIFIKVRVLNSSPFARIMPLFDIFCPFSTSFFFFFFFFFWRRGGSISALILYQCSIRKRSHIVFGFSGKDFRAEYTPFSMGKNVATAVRLFYTVS